MERIDDAAVRSVRTLLAFTEADQREVPKGKQDAENILIRR